MSSAKATLETWLASIEQSLGMPIAIRLKRESHKGRMPHARYLLTEQIGVVVERGYDLLLSDTELRHAGYDPHFSPPRLRDTYIGICPDGGAVHREVMQLDDVA